MQPLYAAAILDSRFLDYAAYATSELLSVGSGRKAPVGLKAPPVASALVSARAFLKRQVVST